MRRVDLMHAHGSPTNCLHSHKGCRCTLCQTAKANTDRSYRGSHRAEAAARERHYRETHREEMADRRRRYYAEHPEEAAERQARYLAKHPEMVTTNARNYRARKRNAPGTHTTADVLAQYARQLGRCFWCKVKVGKAYHVDHVIPLVKKGSNGPENIVISCSTCNWEKSDKHPMDFAGRMF